MPKMLAHFWGILTPSTLGQVIIFGISILDLRSNSYWINLKFVLSILSKKGLSLFYFFGFVVHFEKSEIIA